ncbi:MAG: sulfatase-like hydrolase/transferase, partial [Myxococcales bacterium]|nr:sulfatase-like hydrolase/transferase [Myxococcales bacterium]
MACNARRPVLILLIVAFAVRGLLGVGVVLLVVAPWSVRNARLHGGFVAIETNAPLNFWRGNGADAFAGRDAEETLHDAWRFDSVPVSPVAAHTPRRRVERARIGLGAPQPSDLETIRYASREARRAILSDPAAFISRIPTRLFDMWNPTSFLLRHLQIGTYAEVPGWLAVPISSLAVLAYLLVVALACVGLVLGRRRPETWLVVLIVAGFSAITAVSFGLTHFRLPLMPLLMLLAAGACIRWLPRAGGSPRVAASVALTFVSLGLSGCGRSDERPLPQGPNVLWVVWDTARSDRMGLYGHDLPTTPRLDAWARDARVFENAISTAGSTIPSHASMFTGLLPSEHCAHNDSPRLADELVTLAELMWDAGYRTYLYSENPNVSADPNRNLAQGFEQTEHPWSPDLAEQAFDIVWNKLGDDASDRELKERLRSAREEGVFPRWSIKAAGPLAERALLEWLEDGDAQRPFFAFVNYMEAHRPHIAPRSYRRKLMSPEDVERSYQVDRSWNSMWEYVFGFREYSDEKMRLTRATYDACLLEL